MTNPAIAKPQRTFDWRLFLENYGALIAFAFLLVFSGYYAGADFYRPENLRNIINQNSFVGIIAIGMTFVIISGGIDLSVGSMLALVGVVSIMTMNRVIAGVEAEAIGVVAAVGVALALGPLLGFIQGVLIAKGRVAAFIVTLGGLVGFRSVALTLADGGEVRSESLELFRKIGGEGIPLPFIEVIPGRPLVIYWPILVFILFAIAGSILLNRTRYGRYVYAVGCNETAARYSAIAVDRVKIWTYTLIGFCTGVAALLLAARMNSVGASTMGNLYELDAIAAVVIGGTRMEGGKGRVWGTVIGVLILGLISNMLVLMNVPAYLQGLVKGIVIIAAVLVQRTRSTN
ncbi:MAG: ABC transporter permease [Phycisphaerales bacterium]